MSGSFRHRLVGRLARRALHGASFGTKLAFWMSIYAVLYPLILFVLITSTCGEPGEHSPPSA